MINNIKIVKHINYVSMGKWDNKHNKRVQG
jgi:hypothetical protein